MFDSFCAYRFPQDTRIFMFQGEMKDGLLPGFVIAPFDLYSHDPVTIQGLTKAEWSVFNNLLKGDNFSDHLFDFPSASTTKEEHSHEVETIVSELQGDHSSKTIAAKVICSNSPIDAETSFENLCSAFPNSFVFLFYTPRSGAWLGASPEVLLKNEENVLYTYALAGTRPAGSAGDWDVKNIKEQEIVEKYICDCFVRRGINAVCSPRSSRAAGIVEHILTEIKGEINAPVNFNEFLRDFSPTPALCGFPKIESMNRILRLENFERGYYGGFCGPMASEDGFTFYVNLRSIFFGQERWCMFAGGGITVSSDPDAEWLETERKAEGIIKNLKFLSQK
jgi:hypothetical protein